ncbi:MAG: WD40 repeat domain-containing protein, partial [Pseudomonadota bacterium]
ASGGKDTTVRVWELATGTLARSLAGHRDVVSSIAFGADGRSLVSASEDRTVRVWDVATGKQQRSIARGARQLSLGRDGRLLASAVVADGVEVWDVENGSSMHIAAGETKDVRGWDFDAGRERLATGSEDWEVRLYRTTAALPRRMPAGHASTVQSVVFSRDGQTLASTSDDLTVRLWDASTGAEKRVLAGHAASVAQAAFDPGGELLASASLDNTVRVWNVRTGALQAVLARHSGRVYHVVFSPDGKLLATASDDRTARLWDVAAGVERSILAGHGGTVWEAAFSCDGRFLATASDDGLVRLWEVASGLERRRFAGHDAPVRSVAFHPAGSVLASAALNGTVRIWDLAGGKPAVLPHPGAAVFVTFSPDGKHLVSSGDEARIWDLGTRKASSLPGVLARGMHHRYSPDGSIIVAAPLAGGASVAPCDFRTGMPRWRGPVLLASPVESYTHRGWSLLECDQTCPTHSRQNAEADAPSHAWRRAVEERALLGSHSTDGGLLCVRTIDDRVELWDTASDRLLADRPAAGIEQAVAVPAGCVIRANRMVSFVDRAGSARVIGSDSNAVAWDPRGELLVVSGSQVEIFDASGIGATAATATAAAAVAGASSYTGAMAPRRHSVAASPGITAVARLGEQVVVGFKEGQLELLHLAASQESPRFAFEGVPASQVSRIIEGPSGALIAGYENGTLGIWDSRNGALLESVKLHGSIEHLLLRGGKLYALTGVGDHVVLDLSVLDEDYCKLLGRVWQSVPVAWENGLPVARPIPAKHPSCHYRRRSHREP